MYSEDMKDLVSVIVPVYDSERYISDCIESILAQTYTNIELLLIDDGSTDDSGRICDKYLSDERVRVCHRKNTGVSATRNYGITKAHGDYILFTDSDDTIENDMIEHLIKAIKKSHAQVAFCGMIYDYADGHTRYYPNTHIAFETDGMGAVAEILKDHITMAGPVCKLFKRELIEDDVFPTDLSVAEDALAMVKTLIKADKVVFDMKPLYHYNRREGSLTTSCYTDRDMDVIKSYERIKEILKGYDLDEEVEFRRIVAHFRVYDKLMLVSDNDRYKQEVYTINKWIKTHIRNILINKYVGNGRKIASVILMFSKKAYKKIIIKRKR